MWPYVGAALIGAWLVKRTVPRTRVTRSTVIGGQSGRKYAVEYLEDVGQMVVMGRKAKVAFRQTANGWKAERAAGDSNEINLIRREFENLERTSGL